LGKNAEVLFVRARRIAGFGIGIAAIALLACAFYSIRRGFSAREQPTALEAWVASTVRRMAIPTDARGLKNPLSATEVTAANGMAHWADHCAVCHANNGSGNTAIGRNLYPKSPDMRLSRTQQLTDGELYYIIQNGVRLTGMPAWGSSGDGDHNEDSWGLVLFIRHLPRLTREEETQMEGMNPKSPAEMREEQEEQQFLRGDTPRKTEERRR
jgi:mono/diheme cytochrome c family protein